MAGYTYKHSMNLKNIEEDETNIESCDVLDYNNIKNVLDKINEKDIIIEEYVTKYISEEEKLTTYNFTPTTKNIMESNMFMLRIISDSQVLPSAPPSDDNNINGIEMIEKMKYIPFRVESKAQRKIKILHARYKRLHNRLKTYDQINKLKEIRKKHEENMKCWLQSMQLISLAAGIAVFAVKCVMIANLYNPAVWSAMITSICSSPLQFQIFIDFMQNLYVFSGSEIITLKNLFQAFQVAKIDSPALQDENYIKDIINVVFSETTNKETEIKTINDAKLGLENRTALLDFANFIKNALDSKNIFKKDLQPDLNVNKGLFSLAYSYYSSPLGRETLTTLKIAIEAYGYFTTNADFFSTYKTASPALFFKGIALNSINSLSFQTYNKIFVQNLFQNIVDMNPGILKDNFFLETEIPFLGETIGTLFVTTFESFLNVQITSSIKGYFLQLEKEAGYDPEAEKKREKEEKEKHIDSVIEEIYQRGKKIRRYKNMGYSNTQIANMIDKPERSNNYKSYFARSMKYFYNFFADLSEDPILLLDTYMNTSFFFNLIGANVYGLLFGGLSQSMTSFVLSGTAHKILLDLRNYTFQLFSEDFIPMNVITLFLRFKYGNDTALTNQINSWRAEFIQNISSDLLSLVAEMQSVFFDSSLGMSLNKYLNSLNNTIIGNIFKMSCTISRFFLNYIGIPRMRMILNNFIPMFTIPIIETLENKNKSIRLFAFIDNKFSNMIHAFKTNNVFERLEQELSEFANIGQIIQGTILPYMTEEQYFVWKTRPGNPFIGNIIKILHPSLPDDKQTENQGNAEILSKMTADIEEKKPSSGQLNNKSWNKEIKDTYFIIGNDKTFENFEVIKMEEIETLFKKLTNAAETSEKEESKSDAKPSDEFVKLFKKDNFAYTFTNLTQAAKTMAKKIVNFVTGSNEPTDPSGNLLEDFSVTNIFYYYYLKKFLDEKKIKDADYKLNNFEFQNWLLQKSTKLIDNMGSMQTPNATGVEVAIINNILLSFPKRLLTQSADNNWFGSRWWSYVSGRQGQLVSKIDIPQEGMNALDKFIGHLSDGAFIKDTSDTNFVEDGYGLEKTLISKTDLMSNNAYMGVNIRHNAYWGGFAYSPQVIKTKDFISASELLIALNSDESNDEDIRNMAELLAELEKKAYTNPSVSSSLIELNNLVQEPIIALVNSFNFIIDFFKNNFYQETTSENNIPLKHMSFDYDKFYDNISNLLKKCIYKVEPDVDTSIFKQLVKFIKSDNEYIREYLKEYCEIQFICKDADKTLYLNKNGINMDTGDLANEACLKNKIYIYEGEYKNLKDEHLLRILLRPEMIFQIAEDKKSFEWMENKLNKNLWYYIGNESKQNEERKFHQEASGFLRIFSNIASDGMKPAEGIVNSITLFDIIYDIITKQKELFNESHENKKLMREYLKLKKKPPADFWEEIASRMNTQIENEDIKYDKSSEYWENKYFENYKLITLFNLGIVLKNMKKRIIDKDVKDTLIKYFSQKEEFLDKGNVFKNQIDVVNSHVSDLNKICKEGQKIDKDKLEKTLNSLKEISNKDAINGTINLYDYTSNTGVNIPLVDIKITDPYFLKIKKEYNDFENSFKLARSSLEDAFKLDNLNICDSGGLLFVNIYFEEREKWFVKQNELFKLYILYNTNEFYSAFTEKYSIFSKDINNLIDVYSRNLDKIYRALQAEEIENKNLLAINIGIPPIISEQKLDTNENENKSNDDILDNAIVTPVYQVGDDEVPIQQSTQEVKAYNQNVDNQNVDNQKVEPRIVNAQKISEGEKTAAEKLDKKVKQDEDEALSKKLREEQNLALENQLGFSGSSPENLSNLIDGLLKILPSTVTTNVFAPIPQLESNEEIDYKKKELIKNQLELCQTISSNWWIMYKENDKGTMEFSPTTISDIDMGDVNKCNQTNFLYGIAKQLNSFIITGTKEAGRFLKWILVAVCKGASGDPTGAMPVDMPPDIRQPHKGANIFGFCSIVALLADAIKTYGNCIIYLFHDSLKTTFGNIFYSEKTLNLGNYLGFALWLQMVNSLKEVENGPSGVNRNQCYMVETLHGINFQNLESDAYNMIKGLKKYGKYSDRNIPGFINVGQMDNTEGGVKNYSNSKEFFITFTTTFLTTEEKDEYTNFINDYKNDECGNFLYLATNRRKYLKFGIYSIFMNPTKNVFSDLLLCHFFDSTKVNYVTMLWGLNAMWPNIQILVKDLTVILFSNRELRPYFLTQIFGNSSFGNNLNLMRDLIDESFEELDKRFTSHDGTFQQDKYESELDSVVGNTINNLLKQFWSGLFSTLSNLQNEIPGLGGDMYSRYNACKYKGCDIKEIKKIAEDAIKHVEVDIFLREDNVDKYFFGEKGWFWSSYKSDDKNDYLYDDSDNKILDDIIKLDSNSLEFKINPNWSFKNNQGVTIYINTLDDSAKAAIRRKILMQYKEILSFYKESLKMSRSVQGVILKRLNDESLNFNLIFRYQHYKHFEEIYKKTVTDDSNDSNDFMFNKYYVTPCGLEQRLLIYEDENNKIFSKCINIDDDIIENKENTQKKQNDYFKKYNIDLENYSLEKSKKLQNFENILKYDVDKICGPLNPKLFCDPTKEFINDTLTELLTKIYNGKITDTEINKFIKTKVNKYVDILVEITNGYNDYISKIKSQSTNDDKNDFLIKSATEILQNIENIKIDIEKNILQEEPYKNNENIRIDFIVNEMNTTEDPEYFAFLYLELFNLRWDDFVIESQDYILEHTSDIYKLYVAMDKEKVNYKDLISGDIHFYIEPEIYENNVTGADNQKTPITTDVNEKITQDKYKSAILKQFQILFYNQGNFNYGYFIDKNTDLNILVKDKNGVEKIIPIKEGFDMIELLVKNSNIALVDNPEIIYNAQQVILQDLIFRDEKQTVKDEKAIQGRKQRILDNNPNGAKVVGLMNAIDEQENKKKNFEERELQDWNKMITDHVDEINEELNNIEKNLDDELDRKMDDLKDYNNWIDNEISVYLQEDSAIMKDYLDANFIKERDAVIKIVQDAEKKYKVDAAKIDAQIVESDKKLQDELDKLGIDFKQTTDEINLYLLEHDHEIRGEDDAKDSEKHQKLQDLYKRRDYLQEKIIDTNAEKEDNKRTLERSKYFLYSYTNWLHAKVQLAAVYTDNYFSRYGPAKWVIWVARQIAGIGVYAVFGHPSRPTDIKNILDIKKPRLDDQPDPPKTAFDFYLQELNKGKPPDKKISYADGIEQWRKLWWYQKTAYNDASAADKIRYDASMKKFAVKHPEANIETREINIKLLEIEVKDLNTQLTAIQDLKDSFYQKTHDQSYIFWKTKKSKWKVEELDTLTDPNFYKGSGLARQNREESVEPNDINIYDHEPRLKELVDELQNIYGGSVPYHPAKLKPIMRRRDIMKGMKLTTQEQAAKAERIKKEDEELKKRMKKTNFKNINEKYADINKALDDANKALKDEKKNLTTQQKEDQSEINRIKKNSKDRKNNIDLFKKNIMKTLDEQKEEHEYIQKILLDSDKSQYKKLHEKGFSLKMDHDNQIGLFPFNPYTGYESHTRDVNNGIPNRQKEFLNTSKIVDGLPAILVGVEFEPIKEEIIDVTGDRTYYPWSNTSPRTEIYKLELELKKVTDELNELANKNYRTDEEELEITILKKKEDGLKTQLDSYKAANKTTLEKASVNRINKIIEDKYILLTDASQNPIRDANGNTIRILKVQLSSWHSTFDFDEEKFKEFLLFSLNEKYARDHNAYQRDVVDKYLLWVTGPTEKNINDAFGYHIDFFDNLPIKGLDGATINEIRIGKDDEEMKGILRYISMNIYDTMYDNVYFDFYDDTVPFFIPGGKMTSA